MCSVERIKGSRKKRAYFGTSASNGYMVFSLEDLMRYLEYGLAVSCVKIYAGVIVRHANGSSLPMGGFSASYAAICGGIDCEEVFDTDPGRDTRLITGTATLRGTRIQDDTKLLLGYDTRSMTEADAVAIFHRCVKPMLYPAPFDITIDDRQRFLETESLQIGSFIWYRFYHKNGASLTSDTMAYKSGTHVGSYGKASTKSATVIAHLIRIRTQCVFEQDANWCCICKLLEHECDMYGWRRRDLKKILIRKAQRVGDQDDFWCTLLKTYNSL